MNPRATYVVARVLIASAFVSFGLERVLTATHVLPDRGNLTPLWTIFYAFQMLAGLTLMFGWQAGRVAMLMAIMTGVDAFAAHPFWNFGGTEQQDHLIHFFKSLSGIGGLLLVSWIDAHESQGMNVNP
jgi:putative oxidoreductase